MLSPKKVKFRKQQKGRMRGVARRGGTLAFGEYGLQAVECGKVSSKQIEAARIAMTRHVKRGGKMWKVGWPSSNPVGFFTRWKGFRVKWPKRPFDWRLTSWPSRRALWRGVNCHEGR